MSSVCLFGDITDVNLQSETYKQLIPTFSKILTNLIEEGYDTFYTTGNNSFDLMMFFVVQKLKLKYPFIRNIILDIYNINTEDIWYNKSRNICNNIIKTDFTYVVDVSDKIIIVSNGHSIPLFKKIIEYCEDNNRIINYFYYTMESDILEIKKYNNTNMITSETSDMLKSVISTKSIEALELFYKQMKNWINTQDQLYVLFDENNPLDKLLKTKEILSITESVIEFNDDNQTILIKMK